MKKTNILSQAGFTIAEIMIAVGLLAGLASVIVKSREIISRNNRAINERMEENFFLNSVSQVLSDKRSCLNTLGGLNPTGTTGTTITNIRDEDNNVLYTIGDIIGEAGDTPNQSRGKIEITDMRVSHYNNITQPRVAYNTLGQVLISISFRRQTLGTGTGETAIGLGNIEFTRRLKARVLLTPTVPTVISECLADEDYLIESICPSLNGTYNPTVSARCRSILLATSANPGSGVLAVNDDIAMRISQNANIEGTTIVHGSLQLGPGPFTNPAAGATLTSGATNIVNGHLSTAGGSFRTAPQNGDILLRNGLSISATYTAPPAEGVYVAGNVQARTMRSYGLLQNESADNLAATVEFVSRRSSEALGHGDGNTQNIILGGVFGAGATNNSAARALHRYICNQIEVTNFGGGTVSGVYDNTGSGSCTINPTYNTFHNCQSPFNCTRIYVDALRLGGGAVLNSWDDI